MLQSQFTVIALAIISLWGFFPGFDKQEGTPVMEEVHMFTAWKKSIFLDFCRGFLCEAYSEQWLWKTGTVGFYNYYLSTMPKLNLLSLQVKRYFFSNKWTFHAPHVPPDDVSHWFLTVCLLQVINFHSLWSPSRQELLKRRQILPAEIKNQLLQDHGSDIEAPKLHIYPSLGRTDFSNPAQQLILSPIPLIWEFN